VIDAGMPSHIGLKKALCGKDCGLSILADNSPYYEAGVKICLHQNVCGNASRN
jgi:hypothetical protein